MSAKPKSKVLKDSHVAISRVYQKNTVQNSVFSWRVPKYEELKYDVLYFRMYETRDINCVLRIFKHKDNLHLSVSGDKFPMNTLAEFSVLDEANNSQLKAKAEHICDGVFVGKFSHECFVFPDSNFLPNGVLTVAFKYVSDFYVTYKESKVEETEVLFDLDELCYDLKTMYLESIFPDFYIHVKDFTFKAHQFILAARSKFFDRLLEAKKNSCESDHRLPNDILPGVLHQVLLYIYCGELSNMDLDSMMKIYKLAVDLEVSSLCDRCEEYFKTQLDKDNYMKLSKYAVEFELKKLKNIIVRVTSKFSDVNIFEVFKQIGKDRGKNADPSEAK